jgi:hypothetical protein
VRLPAHVEPLDKTQSTPRIRTGEKLAKATRFACNFKALFIDILVPIGLQTFPTLMLGHLFTAPFFQ